MHALFITIVLQLKLRNSRARIYCSQQTQGTEYSQGLVWTCKNNNQLFVFNVHGIPMHVDKAAEVYMGQYCIICCLYFLQAF